MEKSLDFHNGKFSDMVAVGSFDSSSVRLWIRTHRPGTIKISCRPEGREHPGIETRLALPEENSRDNTCSIRLPENSNMRGLLPLTRYHFQVTHADDGHLIGEGRFETAPEAAHDTPSRFSIALMSCNQPFNKDGTINKKSVQMLRATRQCLSDHDTKYILMTGDQLYTDYPLPLSLFDEDYFQKIAPLGRSRIQECSVAEVRRIFQDRYRSFWNVPEWQVLHMEFPSFPILDDHDIVDNWGSDPAHKTSEWQAFGDGAKMAYFDYQGSRVLSTENPLSPSFHYAFAYGNTATFVMDLRSQRTAGENGQLYSPAQFDDLKTFLQTHTDKKVIFLVLSVPAIHLPKYVAKVAARMTHSGEDFSDRWSSGSHVRDRDRLFKLIRNHQLRHPRQKLVLLSGDIHIGCAQEIRFDGDTPPFYQLISSGITHSIGRMLQVAAKLLMIMNRNLSTQDKTVTGNINFLKGTRRHAKNPYGGMNLGIIEIETPEADAEPRLRFFLYGHRGERPVCFYRSVAF